MASDLYCSRRDVNRWLPSGEITGSSRLAESALSSTETITLDGHGFETDDEVTVRAAEGGSLPAPLVEGTLYYAIRITNATFQLAATASGSPINLTSDGTSVVIIKQPPFYDVIEFYSRWADSFIPAHLVPLEAPIHPLVKVIVAQLSAKALLNLDGKSSEIVNAAELAAKAQLERFAKGLPLRGADATAPANLAVTSTLGAVSDARGWGSGVLP